MQILLCHEKFSAGHQQAIDHAGDDNGNIFKNEKKFFSFLNMFPFISLVSALESLPLTGLLATKKQGL